MSRSLKKGPYVHYKLNKKVEKNIQDNKKTVIKTWSRASMITPDFVGQTIACLLYTSPSPRDKHRSRMPSSA